VKFSQTRITKHTFKRCLNVKFSQTRITKHKRWLPHTHIVYFNWYNRVMTM